MIFKKDWQSGGIQFPTRESEKFSSVSLKIENIWSQRPAPHVTVFPNFFNILCKKITAVDIHIFLLDI